MSGRIDPALVFIDADNTLWDTDGVFAAAQVAMLAHVCDALGLPARDADPLAFLRVVDQAIAERHQDGLRYPPVLLVRGLERALSGQAPDAAARAALRGRHEYRIPAQKAEAIAADFQAALGATPPLREGVRDGLEAMSRGGVRLIVVSEAARSRVERTADAHGILHLFERVFEGYKSPTLYRRMVALARVGGRPFMVGDQMNRDIEPAGAAGLETIYFPGGFQPRWASARGQVAPDHVIGDFSEVVGIVAGRRTPVVAAA
jgi:putative hydrolase of the HAD superfamily